MTDLTDLPDEDRIRYIRARDERFPLGAIMSDLDAPDPFWYRLHGHDARAAGDRLMADLLAQEAGWRSRHPATAGKVRNDRAKVKRRKYLAQRDARVTVGG